VKHKYPVRSKYRDLLSNLMIYMYIYIYHYIKY
jgi:hypothetical protein